MFTCLDYYKYDLGICYYQPSASSQGSTVGYRTSYTLWKSVQGIFMYSWTWNNEGHIDSTKSFNKRWEKMGIPNL